MPKRTPKKKPPAPARLKISHRWPEPKAGDREKFLRLVRMLLKMGSTN
jgi:hypothetical protein